jgi:hypothetical protein
MLKSTEVSTLFQHQDDQLKTFLKKVWDAKKTVRFVFLNQDEILDFCDISDVFGIPRQVQKV